MLVQAEGCAPLVRAFQAGAETAEPWQGAETLAGGLRVPAAIGDFLILRAVRESGGTALTVSDADMRKAVRSWRPPRAFSPDWRARRRWRPMASC